MLFQTYEFLILFLLVLVAVALCQNRQRQQVIVLLASYIMYAWWDVRFLTLMLVSTMLDHSSALGIAGIPLSRRKLLRLSFILAGGAWLLLGLNWPLLQFHWDEATAAGFFTPDWPGQRWAMGAMLSLAVGWPLIYSAFMRLDEQTRKRAFLWTSVALNLSILGFFKYYNFFIDNFVASAELLHLHVSVPTLEVVLPVGISFYTFHTLGYVIDVYLGRTKVETSLLKIAVYVAYFPQLVAGPILRSRTFLPYLETPWTLRAANMRSGFHLVLVGLTKKVLVADQVARLVDVILNDPQSRPGYMVLLGVILFAVQIYCDFSGYTDIARGLSRYFGVEIPLNFNFPYFATSITDFWRKWHISLSTWLRDYLYIPLGGNRHGPIRTYINLFITMLLGGLWHGASWNFIVWGAYHGGLLAIEKAVMSAFEDWPRVTKLASSLPVVVARWALTLWLTLLGWAIFRVTDLSDLWYCLVSIHTRPDNISFSAQGLGEGLPFTALIATGCFAVLHTIGRFLGKWPDQLDRLPWPVLAPIYMAIGFLLFLGWPENATPFIYFQF